MLIPKSHANCWFVCAFGNVWDDKCNYKELLDALPRCKGVLQLNVRSDEIQMKNSPITTQSIQMIEDMLEAPGLSIPGNASVLLGQSSSGGAPHNGNRHLKMPILSNIGSKLWKQQSL